MKIAIIGGGAAGMMVAATLVEDGVTGSDILLFEKNKELGAKVIISGGGRCNVTTGIYKNKELKTYYPRGADLVIGACKKFGPRAIRRWFEQQGIPLKQEADGRIFPVSDDGKDIVRVFEKLFAEQGVKLHCNEGVDTLRKVEEQYQLHTAQGSYLVDALVVTTGGNAYAHTGSSGDGYAFAREVGHTITPLGPSLNSFKTKQAYLHECSGISFPNALLRYQAHKNISVQGPVLLTHFGVSGPATFAYSSHIPLITLDASQPHPVLLQPDADKRFGWRDNFLLDACATTPKKELLTILRSQLSRKFIEAVLSNLNVSAQTKIAQLTKEERKAIAKALGEGILLEFIQRRPGDEFVTAGGVSLTEIDHQSCESLVSPGLYFAGEILDVDGYTGGFNLTSSWSLGRLVAKAIAAVY